MKNRRSFIQRILLVSGLSLFASKVQAESVRSQKDLFKHVVFFWLKKDSIKSNSEEFILNLQKFISQVSVIKSSHIGKPATTDRPVIDKSYDFCLIVSFANKTDHDIYQTHETHLEFIKTSEKLWDRVLVYDSEAI